MSEYTQEFTEWFDTTYQRVLPHHPDIIWMAFREFAFTAYCAGKKSVQPSTENT